MTVKTPHSLIDNAKRIYETTNLSIAKISKIVGVNQDLLSRQFRAMGITIERGRTPVHNTLPFNQEAVQDYQNGMSELGIARKYGITRCPVRKWLIQANVRIRNGSEANYIRMSKMTFQEKQELVGKANNIRRIKGASIEESIKKANFKKRTIGPLEKEMNKLLISSGYEIEHQFPINTYNVDFLIRPNIAVEIRFGRTVSTYLRNKRKRIEYILGCGFHIIAFHFFSEEAFIFARENIIADINALCADPSPVRKYRMISCRVKDCAVIRNQFHQFTRIEAPKSLTYRTVETYECAPG